MASFPRPAGVEVLFASLVFSLTIVPAFVAGGSRPAWQFGALVTFIVIATLEWASMSRHLISIHVHRSGDGDLWISGTSNRGDEITALVSDVERIRRPSSRFSSASIDVARQWSVGLGMNQNDVASFIERVVLDLDPGTRDEGRAFSESMDLLQNEAVLRQLDRLGIPHLRSRPLNGTLAVRSATTSKIMSDASNSLTFAEACAAVCAPGTMFEMGEADVFGVSTKVFVHAPANIRALFAMAAAREDDFIIYEDERWTMPQVLAQAGQIGALLVDGYGVKKGDRVSIAMRNFPEWISTFVAITAVGGVAVPLNAWWQTDELVFAIEDSGSNVVIADEDRLRRMQDAAEGEITAKVIVVRATGDVPEGVVRLEDAVVDGATMPEVDIDPDDDVTILYTSGTTGRPKGAVSTHRALLNALMAFAARAAVGAVREPEVVDPDATPTPTVFMLPVPLFHVTGLVPVMLGSFVSGAKLVMTHRWDPDRALELIEQERVTNFVGVPTMSWDLLEAKTFADRDTSSLKSVGGGGAPMPPELVKRIDDNFSAGRPGLGYGMTETNAYGPQNSGDDFIANPTSTGRPVPIMDLKVTDPEGNTLATGETGEIWFKGPNLIRGYWNRPEATEETIVDGWLRTGDLGHLDEEGFVFISDRAKDMVLRGGENIYSAEVEAAIYEHPAVYECAVYGVPHERLGEEVAAHVMVKADQTLEAGELQKFMGERVASFKVPSIITIVTEALPRNASGKILKRDLREQHD